MRLAPLGGCHGSTQIEHSVPSVSNERPDPLEVAKGSYIILECFQKLTQKMNGDYEIWYLMSSRMVIGCKSLQKWPEHVPIDECCLICLTSLLEFVITNVNVEYLNFSRCATRSSSMWCDLLGILIQNSLFEAHGRLSTTNTDLWLLMTIMGVRHTPPFKNSPKLCRSLLLYNQFCCHFSRPFLSHYHCITHVGKACPSSLSGVFSNV